MGYWDIMGATSAGLPGDGRTPHYWIGYAKTLSAADGLGRALDLLASCEQDFALMRYWFSGVDLKYDYPIPVLIADATGGGMWGSPPDIDVTLGTSPLVTLAAVGKPVEVLRYLLVSEVTEMFMATRNNGWFEHTTAFTAGDEGSRGEGLSRFLGVQFQLANGFGPVPPGGWAVSELWLNSPQRLNFIDSSPDDHRPNQVTGCTTLFLYYLSSQLGYDVKRIINAGADSLAQVYRNLTGRSDAWQSFIDTVDRHYPRGYPYTPTVDNVFPVSELSAFWAPNQVTCGYSASTQIFIGSTAQAEVYIQLTGDDSATLAVPATVTIPPHSLSTALTVEAVALPLPFSPKHIPVHATYAGKTLSISVTVAPPTVVSITLAPDTVTCGESTTATVTLDNPSKNGPVVADLLCGSGFAHVPPQVTIPQGSISASVVVDTPSSYLPFPPAHVEIMATYGETFVTAMLTVNPSIVVGILAQLSLSPATVVGGYQSQGTVTLIGPVPTDTVVGLAALRTSGRLPTPGRSSTVASVPSSVTIPAGSTSAHFDIDTVEVGDGTTQSATIMAGAVVFKYARLTITG